MPVTFIKQEKMREPENLTIRNSVQKDLYKTIAVIAAESRYKPYFCTSSDDIQ